MAIRVLILFDPRSPFGGFRIAMGPGLVGASDCAAFRALERAVHNLRSVLAAYPPDTWPRLARSEAAIGDAADFFEGRPGFIDLNCDFSCPTGDLVVRALLPFRRWPFGGWAVYDAWHREADGSWVPFGEDELNELW